MCDLYVRLSNRLITTFRLNYFKSRRLNGINGCSSSLALIGLCSYLLDLICPCTIPNQYLQIIEDSVAQLMYSQPVLITK